MVALAKKRMNPLLLKRLSPEDVVQSAFENAFKREEYFTSRPDVPLYFKLRTILLQTLTDLERQHLVAAGRNIHKEVGELDAELPGEVTTPVSRVDRSERHRLLRQAVARLDEADRQIVTLRNFDGLGNAECAAVLGLEPKASSMRYVRALTRLKALLMELSCFRN